MSNLKDLKILLFEDDSEDVEIIHSMIDKCANFPTDVTAVDYLSKGLDYLNKKKFDVILSDLGLPDSQGIDTLIRILDQTNEIPIIVMTGLDDETVGIEAVQKGAQDYLIKGKIDSSMLMRSLSYAIERKTIDAKLRKSEERVHKIIKENADGIIVVDKNGVIRFTNPAAEKLFGRKKDGLIGDLFGNPIESSKTIELDIKQKGGKSAVVDMRVVEIDWEGESAYLATLRNITIRKNAENALYKAKSFTESIITNVPSIIYSVDNQMQISYISPKCEQLYGYTADEFKNDPTKLWMEVIHPDDRHSIEPIFEKIRNGESYSIEYRIIDKKGDIHWVQDSGNPSLDCDENVCRLEGNISDITDRKHTEEAFRESEERFRMVTEGSLVGVYIIQDGKFKYVNPKFTQIFGYKSDEIIDKLSPLDITHPEDHDLVSGNINKRFEGKENEMQYVFRGKCKDGKTIHCESLGRKLEYKGQPAIIGTLLDITDRKHMENELKKYTDHLEEEIGKRSQELVQSEKMAAIGQLIAGIMHEVNNPLAFLQGNTQMMQEQIKPIKEAVMASSPDKKVKAEPLMEMMESMINENLEGMNRIKEIALTLKDFAKPDQSQAELSDINKGIKDTLVIVSNHLKYVLDVTTEFEELSNLKCNIAQLNQVFLNLIINSAQAISEHRRETKGNLWIKTWVENNNMNIMFRDDGPGIPKDSQDKIFDAFMTTRKEGTGLGLSISYSIISAHKGKIRVESEEGSGTAFFIELPINNGL